jgi:hypothetical protein
MQRRDAAIWSAVGGIALAGLGAGLQWGRGMGLLVAGLLLIVWSLLLGWNA